MSTLSESEQAKQDRQVEMWKVKKLIKSLQLARGYLDCIKIESYVHMANFIFLAMEQA